MEVLNDMYTMIQEELHVAHGNNLEVGCSHSLDLVCIFYDLRYGSSGW